MARASLFGNRAFYTDTDDDGTEETIVAKPYGTIDLRVAIDIATHGDILFGVDNVLNAGEAQYTPIAPTLIYVGINGHFRKKTKGD